MTMTGYLRQLGRAMTAVEVTDGDGRAMSLDEGLERAVSILTTQTRTGLKVMFIGNGASAAIGSHQALDYWKNGGMRAVTFNDLALLTAISNDYSYPEVFEKPIEMFADGGDVLLAISSSGKSDNILRGAAAGCVSLRSWSRAASSWFSATITPSRRCATPASAIVTSSPVAAPSSFRFRWSFRSSIALRSALSFVRSCSSARTTSQYADSTFSTASMSRCA